ncbi:MAG: hypothetical protein ACRCVV_06990 [Shewanella sp.]
MASTMLNGERPVTGLSPIMGLSSVYHGLIIGLSGYRQALTP